MTEEPRRSRKTGLVAVVILAMVLGTAVLYYDGQLAQQSASDRSTIGGLQSTIGTLQSNNYALRAQLAALNQSGNLSPSSGIDPARIYSVADQSVVTIEGSVLTTVNSFFGQQSSISLVLGSGFVTQYQNADYIVTNYHVVDGMTNMTVTFSNGDAYPGRAIGTDPYSDLAVVQVSAPPSEFTPLQVVPSNPGVVVGQPVFAIGSPYGLSGSLTYGVVSQLGRTIQETTSGSFSISGVIQFSAPINPGNSGGPLLDANGKVIGITSAVASGSQGLGFAIPSSTILREFASLVTNGTYTSHSYLGIGGSDMSYQLAQVMNTNVTYGVLIENVATGSPAAGAGLRAGSNTVVINGQQYLAGGDIIVSVNGARIVSQDALSTYLEQNTVSGQTVQLGIIRGGALQSVTVVLAARPPPPTG